MMSVNKSNKKKYLIETNELIKIYDGKYVVNKININISSGEIVGLLGPNGTGKTTSFYMIVGLINASSGKIFSKEMMSQNFKCSKELD